MKKIEAYECRICQAIVVGTKEQAIAHEQVPKDEPLPNGLVYTKNTDLYFLVTGCRFDYRKSHTIRKDYDSESFHGYVFEEVFLMLTGDELCFIAKNPHNSKLFRNFLKGETYRLLNDEEFERFKLFYEKSNALEISRRAKLEQLTNKLS